MVRAGPVGRLRQVGKAHRLGGEHAEQPESGGAQRLVAVDDAETRQAFTQIQAVVVERDQQFGRRLPDDLAEQVCLVRKVVVEGLLRHAGAGGDAVDAGAIAFLEESGMRRGQQSRAAIFWSGGGMSGHT